ncbi:MAG: Ig domain protein group 2 domain protein [Desulfotomaculum sp. 46_296]|nr:MAG: Ig domain protein group 2 domain protein [Desulfotomaculum sp. 46_296]
MSAFLNPPNNGIVTTNEMPYVAIEANTLLSEDPVQIIIPAETTISAPDEWDGTINVPKVEANNSVVVTPDNGKTASVKAVIEVGFGDIPLSFSNAVRILIPGQAGKDAGYYRGSTFTKITTVLSENTQLAGDALPDNGDGKIDVGPDLVIWTKHFTKFITYTQVDGKTTSCLVAGVETGSHTFKIEAGDAAGNWSTNGPVLTEDTSSGMEPGSSNGPEITFGDIQGHWAQKDIEKLANLGVIKGRTTTSFEPEEKVTRAEFTALLIRALDIEETKPVIGHFADVLPEDWYYGSVETATTAGLVNGVGEGKFAPRKTITREQMIVMIIRTLDYAARQVVLATGEDEQLLTDFSDKGKVQSWSFNSLAKAVKIGLVSGVTPTTLEPAANTTRAQASVMIKRMMKYLGLL